jgi:glycosyltransferase involved in cell wall biosynthesis
LKLAIYSVLKLSNGGGGERWIEHVATHLKKQGIEVTIITTKYGNMNNLAIAKSLVEKDIPVLELSNYNIMFKIPRIQHIKQIAGILSKMDILYFNNAFALNEVFVYLLKKITDIKVISGYHGTFPETGRLARRIYHRLINRNISRSFDAHHVLNKEREALMYSWGYNNIYRIPNGVDTNKFIPRKKNSDTFTVLFAGTMNYQKGVDRFAKIVETINFMETHRNRIKFIILGSGRMSYIPEKLRRKFDNVNYNGYVTDEELVEAYATSHVFVSPSRFDEFGLSILESHAAGTPVVASNLSGPRELILNGMNGFLVNSEVVDDLVKPILHLKYLWSSCPTEYHKYAHNSRARALNFDWIHVANNIREMLKTIAYRKC